MVLLRRGKDTQSQGRRLCEEGSRDRSTEDARQGMPGLPEPPEARKKKGFSPEPRVSMALPKP